MCAMSGCNCILMTTYGGNVFKSRKTIVWQAEWEIWMKSYIAYYILDGTKGKVNKVHNSITYLPSFRVRRCYWITHYSMLNGTWHLCFGKGNEKLFFYENTSTNFFSCSAFTCNEPPVTTQLVSQLRLHTRHLSFICSR